MDVDSFETALRLLPGRYTETCRRYAREAEEFRMRVGQALFFVRAGREHALPGKPIEENELRRTVEKATESSPHTAAHAMEQGCIYYRGLRIGVCGTAAFYEGNFAGFRRYSSLAIRLPRECRGICDGVYPELYGGGFQNTLLLSPPGGGKTTALRELIRKLSGQGRRVAVVDERNELAGADGTGFGFDLGPHSDVLTGWPKPQGAMLLLRGMNPEILAMDEITQAADMTAISEICGCGVGILTSAHAAGVEDLLKRPLYRELMDRKIFSTAILIKNQNGVRSYEIRSLET